LNPAGTSKTSNGQGNLPTGIQDLLRRFIQLAREIEPYVQDEAGDTIYVDYRQGSWTAAMLWQFRREIYPYPAAVGLLEFAAENAGTEVSYRDFLQQSSWTDVQVRSELGAISKVARKLFGQKVWPVRTRQASDGVMRYFMPEGIAEWWMKGGSPARRGD
jgi:hypothetical protein